MCKDKSKQGKKALNYLRFKINDVLTNSRQVLCNEKGFGFITMIIVAIFLVAIITAVLSYTSKSTSVDTSSYSAQSYSSGLISQGTNLKSGFDLMMNTKLKNINEITFDASSGTGLFHPTDGGTVRQVPPVDALDSSLSSKAYYGQWLFRKMKINGIGTDAGLDYAVMIVGVKASVCANINKSVYGQSANENLIASGVTADDWAKTAASSNNYTDTDDANIVDLSSVTDANNKTEACAKTQDNKYVYYQVVKQI
ncbi:MAG: hypothetical protein QXK76_04265 [Candidatus Woesearchaeota archaeon]